jgi:hypothetical protein
VLNSYHDRCLAIIKLFDMFSIKHIPRVENCKANWLAQQASCYIVSQGVFCVASVSLVEHKYALRSKGKLILEDSDRLRDKEKPILGNAKRLPGNTDRLSGKTELEKGRTESEPGETERSLGKEKSVLGNANQLSGNICDSTTSEMRSLSPKIISGDSRRSENAQTHTNKHTIPNMKFKLKLLQIKCHVLGFTKDKAQNVLQKIIRVFAEAFVSHDRHTLFALEESEPPRTTHTCESQ